MMVSKDIHTDSQLRRANSRKTAHAGCLLHPGPKGTKEAHQYDKRRYKRRNRIEITFGRLKDWRRVATRYDRCPEVFLSAIALAATVMFWL